MRLLRSMGFRVLVSWMCTFRLAYVNLEVTLALPLYGAVLRIAESFPPSLQSGYTSDVLYSLKPAASYIPYKMLQVLILPMRSLTMLVTDHGRNHICRDGVGMRSDRRQWLWPVRAFHCR